MSSIAPPPSITPDWLAHRYDPGHDAIHFIQADRETRRAAAFLTDENLPGAASPLVSRRQDVAGQASTRINFVFHSAYCCSTLVANAYDRPGQAMSLKEPTLLNDLVGWRHRGGDPARIAAVLRDSLSVLARPFAPGESCVIKPSNVVNGLAPAMIADRPEAGVLLLYAPLEVYLGSIASKGLWGRLWVRDLLSKQLLDGLVKLGFQPQDYMLQTDLQVAAVGWLAQHALFANIVKAWPDRVRTLDSERLTEQPAAALAALDRLFGVEGSDAERSAIVATIFSRHAKSGDAFSAADRATAQNASATLYRDEIEKVLAWTKTVADQAGVSMQLPAPLL